MTYCPTIDHEIVSEISSSDDDALFEKINSLIVEAEIARLEFGQILDAVSDATWIIDNKGKVLRINKAFLKLLGLKNNASAIGRKCYEFLPCDTCRTPTCPLKRISRIKKGFEMDVAGKGPNRKGTPFLLTASPLFGLVGEVIGVVEQFKDITRRKHFEEELEKAKLELEQLATTDALTGLANRRVFDETLQREWFRAQREEEPISLILCDIDYFKLYNDRYGHLGGDDCLRKVSACIKRSAVRKSDLMARYGGEEFVGILPNTNSKGAYHLAEKIRSTINEMRLEHVSSKVADFVTLSLGVATAIPFKDDGGIQGLIKAADDALYASKEGGRNRVTVTGPE
jgi:diguanylate cyclase (GGDEF)-like protein/PAS domain S-box-containing protein